MIPTILIASNNLNIKDDCTRLCEKKEYNTVTIPSSESKLNSLFQSNLDLDAAIISSLPEDNLEMERMFREYLPNISLINIDKPNSDLGTILENAIEDTRYNRNMIYVKEQEKNIKKQLNGIYHSFFHNLSEETFRNAFSYFISRLEQKDVNTENHSLEVAFYIKALANKEHLPKEKVHLWSLAGLLHDLGKLAIPDCILKKNDKLTEKEWRVMKEHPKIGAHILSGLYMPQEVIDGVRFHHENYDGTGYLNQIKGKNIPPIAKIMRVIDTYSALTSERPHQKPKSKEESIKIMKEGKGKQFDPKYLKLLLDYLS